MPYSLGVARLAELAFTKGHGTSNDFIIIPDPENQWHPSVEQIQWLCDRRRGLGADGLIRVVPTSAVPEFIDLGAAEWFMDYRNSDGSLAEMCGNGARVFARYLLASGLVQDREFVIATRAGLHEVVIHPDYSVSVSMGIASFMPDDPEFDIAVSDSLVLSGGRGVLVPNPHVVVYLPDGQALDSLNISHASVESIELFPAVALTAMDQSNDHDSIEWRVDVPGGTLWVKRVEQRMWLRGPAELVARGKVLIPAELL